MNTFRLTISSPDGNIFQGEAVKLSVRGIEGDLAVMAGTCHNGKVTLDTSDGQLYCLTLKNIAVRGGNCQSECVHTSIPLAFSTASSIVPTNRNADSGRSSCLPSIISLKPLIVSESGT